MPSGILGTHPPYEKLAEAENGGEHVVEVVSYPAGQATGDIQAPLELKVLLNPAPFGDVLLETDRQPARSQIEAREPGVGREPGAVLLSAAEVADPNPTPFDLLQHFGKEPAVLLRRIPGLHRQVLADELSPG